MVDMLDIGLASSAEISVTVRGKQASILINGLWSFSL
jgi:hypothetical protein